MPYIPAAMNGNEIQHDIKFAEDGPISGVVDGVQSITLSAATTTLKFTETSASGEVQMKSNFLLIDPNATQDLDGTSVGRIVKLPTRLVDENNVVVQTIKGRRLVISNGADAESELLTLQDKDGNHICHIGFQEAVEFMCISDTDAVMTTTLRKHTVKLLQADINKIGAADTAKLLPAVAGVAYNVVAAKFVSVGGSGEFSGSSDTLVLSTGSIDYINAPKAVLETAGTTFNTVAAVDLVPVVNTALTVDTSGSETTASAGSTDTFAIKFYYYEV